MKRIGVLTSGGDAPGMNAAVRAVVRTAIHEGVEPFAIYDGYQGLIDGGDSIRPIGWNDVGGILHKGGTIIGTARCQPFRSRDGRRLAVLNLVQRGIDSLVVCGGDGSLTGANLFRQEWPSLVAELVQQGKITIGTAKQHAELTIAGLAGSIDNDLCGTDMTIGADTALHRITQAIDQISSTAASHQRAFVIEVMGRNCGYLAMMSAIASGADWALIPESPPNLDNWEDKMCEVLRLGRVKGRRDSIVVVAEGARDRHGVPISAEYVKQIIEERLNEDVRITILGHVQRGGSPSIYDRNLSTLTAAAAVRAVLDPQNYGQAKLVGTLGNKISLIPLEEALAQTKKVYEAIQTRDFDRAIALRGSSFTQAWQILRTLVRAYPHEREPGKQTRRIGVLTAGAPSPGMNTAVRAAVRLGVDKGHELVAIRNGFRGLIRGEIEEQDWMSVNGFAAVGGSELGTNRTIPVNSDFYAIARNLEEHNIDALLVIGGWSGYKAAHALFERRHEYPAFNIPMICLPATIDNDLPGSELSVGTDTALNNIMEAVDKIKQSAVASQRVFVVEVMGRTCGYLALMSAMGTGAERVYLPEEGVTLSDLQRDVQLLIDGFQHGKRLGMMIRNEVTSRTYDTAFMMKLFEEEGGDHFDVRAAILGHLQQGGDPSPFDRILASRMALQCIEFLEDYCDRNVVGGACIGLIKSKIRFTDFADMMRQMDVENDRPKDQWWLALRPINRILSQPKNLIQTK
ncbi:MAG: 6-phosphofructokinase [Candidatus Promineifilaceae bacterium]